MFYLSDGYNYELLLPVPPPCFLLVRPSTWDGLPLVLCLSPRNFSPIFSLLGRRPGMAFLWCSASLPGTSLLYSLLILRLVFNHAGDRNATKLFFFEGAI